jgi:hypothetical protein
MLHNGLAAFCASIVKVNSTMGQNMPFTVQFSGNWQQIAANSFTTNLCFSHFLG